MAKNICSVCGEKFEDEYFDKEQNKCILHTVKNTQIDKSLNNKFYSLLIEYIKKNKFVDNEGKISLHNLEFPDFESDNYKEIKSIFNCKKITFNNCNFYGKIVDEGSIEYNFYSCEINELTLSGQFDIKLFNKGNYGNISASFTTFNDIIFYNISDFTKITQLDFSYSIIEKKFILDNKIKIDKLNLEETEFKNKVKIQFCNIDDANFYNTKFKDLADFYQTKFQKVNFERTDFEKISVFSECKFNCDVDFKYTKFLGKNIFRDAVIKGKLDLRNTIFNEYTNFLDITFVKREKSDNQFIGETTAIKVSNRETARVIKDFYDSSNNIIEANKYYALEMKEREKELSNDIKKGKNFFDWLVFKIHGITSNHSQDWLLALFWIISLSYGSLLLENSNDSLIPIFVSIVLGICISSFDSKLHRATLIILLGILNSGVYLVLSNDFSLHNFANKLNPINYKDMTFSMLVYKSIIAYLIYQFIISIRQNTRRK